MAGFGGLGFPLKITGNPGVFLAVSVGTQWETRGKNAGRGLGRKRFPQKKVLSLVLCVAMLLSVMVMGTGAAFTDQDEIQNAEAVDMTSALGIIDGYEDGSFQPAENIERGEAAKMISAMLNGGRDSVQETTESSYNDVLGSVDAWANKYIEYCTARGIVSGVGGDRFAPASNVTGTQLAKMLLVSLGYDSVKEGYQDNAMWSVNVNTDAVAAGLYAGIETIDMSAPLSRDNAAQMIWNALQAKTVVYLTDSTGAIEFQSTTLLDKVYGAATVTGIMTAIDYNVDTEEYTYTVDGKDYTSTADYSALFAQTVKVLAKDDEAMMIRTDKGGVVVEATIGDISGTDNDHFNSIDVNGTTYRLDNTAKDWDNFWTIACGYNQYGEQGFWGIPGAGARHTAYDQYTFAGIDQDGGGDIDVIVVYPYVVLKTTSVYDTEFNTRWIDPSDAAMTVDNQGAVGYTRGNGHQDIALFNSLNLRNDNAVNEVEYTDVIVNGTVARNGYVMAVPSQYTATGVDTYTVLDVQTGTADKLNSADRMVTFSGTEYNAKLLDTVVPIESISLKDTYNFVEVNGYLFVVDGNSIAPVTDEYVVVTKTAANSHGADKVWETDLLFTDGSTKRVDVYVAYDNNSRIAPEVGSLYTYRVNLDGDYELIAVPGGTEDNNWGPDVTNFDVQQAYKTGATLNDDMEYIIRTEGYWTYDVVSVDPTTGAAYNLSLNINSVPSTTIYYGNYVYDDKGTLDTSDDTVTATQIAENTDGAIGVPANTPIGTYYYNVTRHWVPAVGDWNAVNTGVPDMFVKDSQNYFYGYESRPLTNGDRYYIEDDAVVFVYNYMMDEYSVVKGSDLDNNTESEIMWAFTGANVKGGNNWVDLAYVAVANDPDETLVYAYVDGDPIRTTNEDGNHILTVDVILADGEKTTLTTKAYAFENDPDLDRLYSVLDENDIVRLIVEDGTLIDIKEYWPAQFVQVTGALYNNVLELNNIDRFVTSDTVFIPVSERADSIADIQPNTWIHVVLDGDDVVAVIY